MFNISKKNISKIDKTLIISVFILVIYGLVVLYSAGSSLSNHYFRKQLIATIIGIIVVFFIISLDNHIIKKLNIPMYIICNVLLVLVLFFGVGDEWGARSWFKFGPINFQPSEIMKIVLIISLANIIESNKNSLNNPKILLKILIFAFIPVALILKQPDSGTAMVYTFIIIVMLFTAGIDWKYLIGAIILGIVSLPFLYLRLDQFQRDRILNFVHPERDLSNTGWQALQGKIAIGSGKLTGEGFLNGVQSQYNFIPEKQTDFIFAVLVEEFGFIGGFILILLYALMLYRCVVIAQNSDNLYSKLLTIGFAAMFLFHIFENIGMTIGVMPITGIPLPFFSYGGTFQIINLISIGLIISSSIQKDPLNFI